MKMASLIKDPNGSFRIEVVIPDGSRKRVRLGKVPVKTAESWHRRIEALVSDLAAGEAHGRELSAWLADLPPKLHDRLVRAGLAEPRAESKARAVVTLAELCEAFKGRASVKASTHAAYQQTLDSLTAALGLNRDIATITPADADDWRKAIATAREGEGKHKKARVAEDGRLSSATVAKRVAVAKQVFGKAVSWGMLEKNPFAGLRAGSQVNPARSRYIDVPTIERVIAAAPGPQWRALIGLCRYAGLRCPSEIGLLTWADVDWSGGRWREAGGADGSEAHAESPNRVLANHHKGEPGDVASTVSGVACVVRDGLGSEIPGPRRSQVAWAFASNRSGSLPHHDGSRFPSGDRRRRCACAKKRRRNRRSKWPQ
jgi:hypothetical protein